MGAANYTTFPWSLGGDRPCPIGNTAFSPPLEKLIVSPWVFTGGKCYRSRHRLLSMQTGSSFIQFNKGF
jgi:hypothetical protein